MATRTAQIIIQVDDKSLVELNAEIKQLETSVKNLKIGTTEWINQNNKLGVLKTRFKEATDEAKKLQGQVQKISGADQVRSIAKLGAGMVGAFAAASGSLKLLGVNSKAFDEMTAKATTLMSIMGGLNQISELFSSTNLKGLRGIGAGFKGLVTSVKGASLAMKTALISTGIGALVVAVGLLVANWDKIKGLFSNQKASKAAEENYKLTQEAVKLSEENYKNAQKLVELEKQKNFLKTSASLIAKTELDNASAYLQYLKDQQTEITAYNTLLENKGGETKKLTDEERAAAMELNQAKLTTLGTEIQISDILKSRAKTNLSIAEKVDDINIKIKEYQNRLIEISNNQFNQRETYEKQEMILKKQIEIIGKKLEIDKDLSQEEIDQVNTLDAQIKALDEQERQRLKALKDELLLLNYEKTVKDLTDAINDSTQVSLDLLNEEVNRYNEISTFFDKQIESTIDLNKRYDELVKKREVLANFDKKGFDMFNQQNQQLIEQLKGYDDLYEQTKDRLSFELKGEKVNERILNINARELSLYELMNNAKIEKLKYQNQGNELDLKNIEIQKEQIVSEDKITLFQISHLDGLLKEAQIKLKQSKSEEERKVRLEKVFEIESEIAGLNKNIADNKTKTIQLDGQIIATENNILKTNDEINQTVTDTNKKQKDITAEIKNQSRAYKVLQNFVGKYSEEIQAALKAVTSSMEVVASLFERQAANRQDEITRLNIEYDNMMRLEENRQDTLLKYEEELKDANGDRYDELLRLIDQEKKAKNSVFLDEKAHKNEIAKLEHQRLVAEHTAAIWRKAQAIIDGIVQGALAVIKALPNVFLSVAVGILSAAGVATIAAQKIPDVPPLEVYKEGGFTGEGDEDEVAGVVHKKEYIIPAKVVKTQSAQHHIAALEEIRTRGYQGGGFVAPVNGTSSTSVFDYEKLAQTLVEAIKEMPPSQVSLVAVDNGLRQVQLTKNNAGISR